MGTYVLVLRKYGQLSIGGVGGEESNRRNGAVFHILLDMLFYHTHVEQRAHRMESCNALM